MSHFLGRTDAGPAIFHRGFIANRAEVGDFRTAIERFGADLPARVLGEYAVAAVDGPRAILTHDALGIAPLFYSFTRGGLAFGTRLADLVRETGAGEIDEEYVAEYLAFGHPAGERTPYRHIRRLPPGSTLLWDGRRATLRKIWDLSKVRPIRLADDREYEERFRELVAEAVRTSLPEGRAWAELSGGLDSSTVASIAGVDALSIVYGRAKESDETPWIRSVVERHGLAWHAIDGDEAPPFSEVPTYFTAEPDVSMFLWSWHRRYDERLRARNVDVLLTGIGGDVVFGGRSEPWSAADLPPHRILREAARWPRRGSLASWILEYAIRPRLRRWLPRPASRAPWVRPGLARRAPAARSRAVTAELFLEALHPISMGVGARDQHPKSYEFRHPLLYRPLVEFMFAIPWDQLCRPGEDRSLQRRALRGILPEPVRTRRCKRGPVRSFVDGLRSSREWLRALTDRPQVVERGWVDESRWLEEVARARHDRTPHWDRFLATAAVEMWLRNLVSFS